MAAKKRTRPSRRKPRLKDSDAAALQRFTLLAQAFADEIAVDKDAMSSTAAAACTLMVDCFPDYQRVIAAHCTLYAFATTYGFQQATQDASHAALDIELEKRFDWARRIAHAALDCTPAMRRVEAQNGELSH